VLAPFFDTVQGLDISPGMVDQYNELARKDDLSPSMRANVGDLVKGADKLDAPEYFGFDLIVMSMALHHIEDPSLMIKRLSERLGQGGILLIIDWVSSTESGCSPFNSGHDHPVHRTVSHLGFKQKEIGTWFEDAGLQSFTWRWAAKRSYVPEQHGGDSQLFFAKAAKL
jgi:SAM-dependent methyltransferase